MTDPTSSADVDLRAAARRRPEARAGSWRSLAHWAVLAVLFVGLRAVSSPGGHVRPVRPIIGVGIGVASSFLESYGSRRITEHRVDAELARSRD